MLVCVMMYLCASRSQQRLIFHLLNVLGILAGTKQCISNYSSSPQKQSTHCDVGISWCKELDGRVTYDASVTVADATGSEASR